MIYNSDIQVGDFVRFPVYGKNFLQTGWRYGHVTQISIDTEKQVLSTATVYVPAQDEDFNVPLLSIEKWAIDKPQQRYHKVFPLTIIRDRYDGSYSGGEWLAFDCWHNKVPPEVSQGDATCAAFWGQKPIHQHRIGVGDTIDEAVIDLENKIRNKIPE